MTSSRGSPLAFHNIQEIVDIEWMFELICMSFYHHYKLSGKEEITVKSSKLLLYYCAIAKYMCLFFDQLTSYQVSR